MKKTKKLPHFSNTVTNDKIRWIKILDDTFNIEQIFIQTSIGSHVSIDLTIDIDKYPNYYNYFVKLFESQSMASKFNITTNKFAAIGSIISSIDIDFESKMNLKFKSDILNISDIQDRRDGIIDDILN